MHLVLHGAHLQSGRVAGRVDGALAVGHVAKSVLRPGQTDQAFGADLLEQVLTDRAVHDLARVVVVAEQERNVHDLHLGHEIAQGAGGGVHEILRAQLHGFDHLAFTAQGGVGKLLALVAACRAFLDRVAERDRTQTVVGIDRVGITDLQHRLRLNGTGEAEGSGCGDVGESHVMSPGWMGVAWPTGIR